MARMEKSIRLPQLGGHLLAPLTAAQREARGRGGDVRYVFLSAAVASWHRSWPAAERLVVRMEKSILLPQRGGHLRRSRPATERLVVGMEKSMHLPQHGGHPLTPPMAGRREARGQDGEVNTSSSAWRPPPGADHGRPERGV